MAAFRSKHKSVEDAESSDMEEDMEEAPAEDTDADDAQADEDISWMLLTFVFPGVTVHLYEHSAVVMVPVLDQFYFRYK